MSSPLCSMIAVARQLVSTSQDRRQFGRPLRRGRRSRPARSIRSRRPLFPCASDSAAQWRRTATPVACARPQPPWVRIDVCLDGAASTRVRLSRPASASDRPDGRASRHGQLPGQRARSPPAATPAADAELQSVPAAAESRAGHPSLVMSRLAPAPAVVSGSPSRVPPPSAAARWVRGCTRWCIGPRPPTAPTNPG